MTKFNDNNFENIFDLHIRLRGPDPTAGSLGDFTVICLLNGVFTVNYFFNRDFTVILIWLLGIFTVILFAIFCLWGFLL